MGLSDRDYMRERNAEVFGKRKSSQNHPFRSTLWMILTWITIIFLLYRSFLWLEIYRQASKEFNPGSEIGIPEKTPITNSRKYVPSTNERGPQNAPIGSELPTPDTRTVTKCLLNGQVTFTDRKCPSGSTNSYVSVNTANVGTVAPRTFVAAAPQIEQQVVVQQPTVQTNNAASMHESECNFLKQQIDQIDALARQPLSGQAQDELSAQRKKFRSRQFALHC